MKYLTCLLFIISIIPLQGQYTPFTATTYSPNIIDSLPLNKVYPFIRDSLAQSSTDIQDFIKKYEARAIKEKDTLNIGQAYVLYGEQAYEKGNSKKAIEYFITALPYFQRSKPILQALPLEYISNIYINNKSYSKAQEYLNFTLELAQQYNDTTELTNVYNELGYFYDVYALDEGEAAPDYQVLLQKSLDNYEKGLLLAKRRKDTAYIMYILLNRSSVLYTYKNYKQIIKDNQKLLAYYQGKKDGRSIAVVQYYLGVAHQGLEKYSLAETYLKSGLKMVTAKGFGSLIPDFLEALQQLYEAKGNYKKAYQYLNHYTAHQDSIQQQNNLAEIAQLELKYSTQQKEKENQFLNLQNETLQTRYWVVVGIAVLLFVLTAMTAWLFRASRKKKRAAEDYAQRLKELGENKTRFFDNITHEFRTPLTLIKGPLELLLSRSDRKETTELQIAMNNTNRLSILIDRLLNLSKLAKNRVPLHLSKGDIVVFTRDTVSQFQLQAKQKNVNLNFETSTAHYLLVLDFEKWDMILYNLLSNALKFTPQQGEISITLSCSQEDGLQLKVQDNGEGIEVGELPYIFDRFYQTKATQLKHSEGSGIGLALTKELVELQSGVIQVESEFQQGTTFEIQIPPQNNNNISDNFIPKEVPTSAAISVMNKKAVAIEMNQGTVNRMLLIEDNYEMRTYIRRCIADLRYQILEADNGRIGLELALEEIPEMIICDVRLPEKDGFSIVSALRQDIRTSHIPIILLTAKVGLQNRLEGLSRGADVYLTKPFSPEELRLQIQRLTELHQRLQARYQIQSLEEPILHLPATEFEQEDTFIKKIEQLILQHIMDEKLDGNFLAQQVFISRGHFYRKIKALTNLTVGQFINQTKLKYAIELMQTKDYIVSEIAILSGFTSPSYFARVCKKNYGQTPTEMMEKSRNNS